MRHYEKQKKNGEKMEGAEKTITHLQIIHTWADFAFKKDINFFNEKHMKSITEWTSDAIKLIKEQQELNDYLNKEVKRLNNLLRQRNSKKND